MKVILTSDIKGTGKEGALVIVSDGFARNHLIPKKLAVPLTKQNAAYFEKKRKLLQKKAALEKAAKLELAKTLGNLAVVIKVDAGESGKLFGSVTSSDIASAVVAASGVVIDKRDVELSDNIKGLGTYEISVKLHPEVSAKVKVEVQAK